MLRILLTGSDSPLGLVLHEFLLQVGRHEVIPLTRATCRWKSERQAKKAVQRAKVDAMVDLRVLTALDSAEEITDLEVDRCDWLAKACQRNGVAYLHLSSSRLFSGRLDRLYSEDDYPDSDDKVGRALLRAEEAVRDRCERHLILRLGPVFSHHSGNWLPGMMARLGSEEKLSLDNNLRGNPVAADDAARVISGLLDQLSAGAEPWGIYHYCSSDNTNAFELAEALLAAASQFAEFDATRVELDEMPEAHLPANRALDCRKIRNTFAIKQVPWRDFVTDTVKLYFQAQHQ